MHAVQNTLFCISCSVMTLVWPGTEAQPGTSRQNDVDQGQGQRPQAQNVDNGSGQHHNDW